MKPFAVLDCSRRGHFFWPGVVLIQNLDVLIAKKGRDYFCLGIEIAVVQQHFPAFPHSNLPFLAENHERI
jgi:hypothetical protein